MVYANSSCIFWLNVIFAIPNLQHPQTISMWRVFTALPVSMDLLSKVPVAMDLLLKVTVGIQEHFYRLSAIEYWSNESYS